MILKHYIVIRLNMVNQKWLLVINNMLNTNDILPIYYNLPNRHRPWECLIVSNG